MAHFSSAVRTRGFAVGLVASAVVVLAPGGAGANTARAADDPVTDVECRSMLLGTASTPKDNLPPDLPDAVDEKLNAAASVPATPDELGALPARVDLRTDSEGFNVRYQFAARGGQLFVTERGANPDTWRRLRLPDCLDGHVQAISVDDEEVIAVDEGRRVYTMDYGLDEIWTFNWTARWGQYFWANLGMVLPEDVAAWSLSDLTAKADGGFTDEAGNFHSSGGVTTIYALRGDRQRITYFDPWLPIDTSYEMCGPERGTKRLSSISASGSSVFVAAFDGSLWTRLYDFDISGANTIFVDYSYEDQRDVATPRVQLPAPAWVEQPAPPGTHTDLVSIEKTGRESTHRILRVEGTNRGETGFWEKDWNAPTWTFHATGLALRGTTLPVAAEAASGPAEDLVYRGEIGGIPVENHDFNPYCTPSTLHLGPEVGGVDVVLHSVDGLRQEQRARGLDDTSHEYYAAIEVSQAVLDDLDGIDPTVAAFIGDELGNRRFTPIALSVTARALRFGSSLERGCHELSRVDDGVVSPVEAPPFALRPRLPRDPGADLAALSGAWDDARTGWRC